MTVVKVKTKKHLRVVGYYGAEDNLNVGKKAEHAKRKVLVG